MIWAVDIDLPYVADYTLGAILLISGLIAMAMSGIAHLKQRRARADHSAGFGQTYRY